jgi:hypothetical protein
VKVAADAIVADAAEAVSADAIAKVVKAAKAASKTLAQPRAKSSPTITKIKFLTRT